MRVPPLTRQVLNTVTYHDLLRPGDRVLVCCQGDAASTALAYALADLGRLCGFSLHLTLVHAARPLSDDPGDGEEAASAVTHLATALGIPARLEQLDVLVGGKGPAEEARRTLVARVACEEEAAALAEPTTADDRVEAVLAGIVSGNASVAALAGPPIQEPLIGAPQCRIVRPLWQARRADVERDLAARGVERPKSAGGAADGLTRRLRDELLPTIERRFNPRIREAILRLADSAASTRQGKKGAGTLPSRSPTRFSAGGVEP